MAATRSVLVICDGLRADLIRPGLTPAISRLGEAGCRFTGYRSMFPCVTRVCSASIATGCRPASHGLSGNTVCLDEGAGLVPLNVGAPDFRDRLRKARGHTLRRPTLAERLAEHGGAILFSNVSPGAAYFHDPDGHGWVHHRAGSFGPGMRPAEPLDVTPDAAGDERMAERFCREVLLDRRPRHAGMWLCQPDKSGHLSGLGSPDYVAALAAADRCVDRVVDALRQDDPKFDRTLLIVGSDHGMETVRRLIPVDERLVSAKLKDAPGSCEVVVAPNGTAALIYVAEAAADRVPAIAAFLRGEDYVDRVLEPAEFELLGVAAEHGLRLIVTMRQVDEPNEHGILGLADAAADPGNDATKIGGGQHGGLGRNEQRPFLIVLGPGYPRGAALPHPATPVDIAPTILRHHGLPFDGMDGAPLPHMEDIGAG